VYKPVIAAIDGHASAAGLETILLVDIRIADERAEFGAVERRWTIVAGNGMTVRLPLVVGFGRAVELIITGRRIDSAAALSIGLVNEVGPAGTTLGRAHALVREMGRCPKARFAAARRA
jgi:enoyl-CoA hydratase